jgi:DNA topoisomerase-3
MLMTSVSGHLLNLDFDDKYRKWWSCSPIELVSIYQTFFSPLSLTKKADKLEAFVLVRQVFPAF